MGEPSAAPMSTFPESSPTLSTVFTPPDPRPLLKALPSPLVLPLMRMPLPQLLLLPNSNYLSTMLVMLVLDMLDTTHGWELDTDMDMVSMVSTLHTPTADSAVWLMDMLDTHTTAR